MGACNRLITSLYDRRITESKVRLIVMSLEQMSVTCYLFAQPVFLWNHLRFLPNHRLTPSHANRRVLEVFSNYNHDTEIDAAPLVRINYADKV